MLYEGENQISFCQISHEFLKEFTSDFRLEHVPYIADLMDINTHRHK